MRPVLSPEYPDNGRFYYARGTILYNLSLNVNENWEFENLLCTVSMATSGRHINM